MRVTSSWVVRIGLCLFALGLAGMSSFLTAAPKSRLLVGGLPDLRIDATRLGTSLTFEKRKFGRKDCAVVEGCVLGSGLRHLMRFDVAILNLGSADLVLGDPSINPAFEYSPCHRHYHFTGFVKYELFDLQTIGVRVAGRKQAFCLEDYEKIPGYVGAGAGKFTCSNQGITVGWQDVYRAALDCQWLDVTNVPPGKYILRVTVDVDKKIQEENETNNVAEATVTIP